jgi:pimeloyl-ACP methyl ester carboxylesterase
MVLNNMMTRLQACLAFAALCPTLSIVRSIEAQTARKDAGDITERIVQVQTKDDVTDSGAVFTPPKNVRKPLAVIWIHGATLNFYDPSYLAIGRAMAEHGYTFITGNTRMHDLGNDEAWKGGKRIRGGTYWGIPSEQVRDIAAWIDFAERLGFTDIVLAGHSAGANAVREYEAQTLDPRVAGVVLASGDVRPDTRVPPPEWVPKARKDIADGKPEELVQGPFLSAATFLDIVDRSAEFTDFFGELSSKAGVTRIHCPILIIVGTNGDVGNQEDLDRIKSAIKHLAAGPIRVDTAQIQGADHMYEGQQKHLAEVIANWWETLGLGTAQSGTHKDP